MLKERKKKRRKRSCPLRIQSLERRQRSLLQTMDDEDGESEVTELDETKRQRKRKLAADVVVGVGER